jgi:protoporphyrinogen oxidase/glycosyltransferase involved in cell wall biosynthesis
VKINDRRDGDAARELPFNSFSSAHLRDDLRTDRGDARAFATLQASTDDVRMMPAPGAAMTGEGRIAPAVELPPLVVFSHLRWDSPYRRSQEILSRIAQRTRVLFVEEPQFHAGDPGAIARAPVRNVTVLTPRTPLNAPGFHDDQIPLLSKLVGNALVREQMHDYSAWLDTPMALPLLKKLRPRCIVYDCIADLAALPGAPRQIAQREHALLRMANVVLCASTGLWRVRRAQRGDVHCVADSVDAAHFGRALDSRSTHPEVRALARPRLGYAGTIDGRVDYELLNAVALARPEWEICLVGPIANDVDRSVLPRAPNVHFFGARAHGELPSHFAGWDVALLPMVRDDAAHFAAGATALEYMAAGRAIVSTPIRDLAGSAGHLVRFGADASAFVAACEAALTAPAEDRAQRARGMADVVAATSWDGIVRELAPILHTAAAQGLTPTARRMLEPAQNSVALVAPRMPARSPCVILGAGATGLAAAYHYGAGCTLVEREAQIGGGCRSIEDTGFTFDRGGHVMMSDDPHVQELYRLLLGDNVHWQECDVQVIESDGATANVPTVAHRGAPVPRARFGYPLRGGFAALVNGFVPLLRGNLFVCADVRKVSPMLRTVTLADGRRLRYDVLVSTLPLPILIAAMDDEAPAEIRRAAAALRHTSLRCVNLGVARPHVTGRHWIEFRGGAVFARVFAQGNLSPHCNPPGGFGLMCEVPYSEAAPLAASGAALTERCVRDLVRAGLLHRFDGLLTSSQVDVAFAKIADGGAEEAACIRDWLADFDIVPAGRFGAWQDGDAFVAGRNAALAAQRGSADSVAVSA